MASADAVPASSSSSPTPSWLPLESNPEVLNPFVKRLGLPDGFGFCDVFGLDEELLMMVPQPCFALCLLFPSPTISPARKQELKAKVKAEGGAKQPGDVFFIQQHDGIGNACGTIASIHAVANAAAGGAFSLAEGSILEKFTGSTAGMTCGERGRALAETTDLQQLSDATAAAGETEGAGTQDAQDSHFICFTHVNGTLYELDGRIWDESGMAFPVNHGATTPETFVSDAAKVIREDFMARDPENMNFNVTALCKLD